MNEIYNKDFIESVTGLLLLGINKYVPEIKINEKAKQKFLDTFPLAQIPKLIRKQNKEISEEDDKETFTEIIEYPLGIKEKYS